MYLSSHFPALVETTYNHTHFLLLIIILFACITPGTCVPLPTHSHEINSTEDPYVPAPRTRGTFGLLWSCLVTYGICIWTAVHKDVVPLCGLKHRLGYKILWVLCALFLPEFLLIVALSQLRQARDIRDHWNKRFPDTLGLQGGFFLLMGGYTIRVEDQDQEVSRVPILITLTADGFRKLVDSLGTWQEKEIPTQKRIFWNLGMLRGKGRGKYALEKQKRKDSKQTAGQRKAENLKELVSRLGVNPFDSQEIEDKGKADSVSKAIVSVQTLWFLAQCFARKLDKKPVTLAEMHVAIQIVYAAFMYACWWYKPLDVTMPISFFLDSSLLKILTDDRNVSTSVPAQDREQEGTPAHASGEDNDESGSLLGTARIASLSSDRINDSVGPDGASIVSEATGIIPITHEYFPCMPLIVEVPLWNHHKLIYRMWHAVMGSFQYNKGHVSELLGMLLSGLNGILHGLAWNQHFPSKVESLLWKLSCFGLFLFPFLTYLASLRGDCVNASIHEVWKLRFAEYNSSQKKRPIADVLMTKDFFTARNNAALRLQREAVGGGGGGQEVGAVEKPGWSWLFTVDVTFIMFFGYTMCIGYFIVEAFISIRNLPVGSYDLPSWAVDLPHI